MRVCGGYLAYLDYQNISKFEREIIIGFIQQRNTIRPTSTRTQGKQAYEGAWICRSLGEITLDKCTVHDLLKVAGEASSGKFTKNSRQTKIVTLKALANYIHRFHHPIQNIDLLMRDVKAGSAAKNRKVTLTLEEWNTIRNLPMPAKSRAELYMMYDGYHRPGELAILEWSDLKQDQTGEIQYDITFKTEKQRTIVMRSAAIEILEAWRKECGALLTDDTPIFPAPDNGHYRTITHLTKLFKRLKQRTGIDALMPSILRNSGMQHDLEAGYPVSYVCLRAWGEPYNDLINLYTKPDSGKIQRDQHGKGGIPGSVGLGSSREYTTEIDMLKKERDELQETMDTRMALMEKHISEILKKKTLRSTLTLSR